MEMINLKLNIETYYGIVQLETCYRNLLWKCLAGNVSEKLIMQMVSLKLIIGTYNGNVQLETYHRNLLQKFIIEKFSLKLNIKSPAINER